MIKTLEEHVVLDNGFVKIYNDKVLFPDQSTGYYYKTALSDRLPQYGVAGVVVTEDNEIILLDNFRYAHQSFATEIVKGMGMVGLTPLETFIKEMQEETGYTTDDVSEVVQFRGDSHEFYVHGFIAKGAKPSGEVSLDATEVIDNIRTVSIEQAREMIENGEITDSATLLMLQQYLLLKNIDK